MEGMVDLDINIPSKYRAIVYGVVLVASVAAIVFGVVTPEQVDEGVAVALRVISAVSAVLARRNLNPDPQ